MCEPAEPTHAAIGLGSSAELQAPQTLTDEETNPELVCSFSSCGARPTEADLYAIFEYLCNSGQWKRGERSDASVVRSFGPQWLALNGQCHISQTGFGVGHG